MFVITAACRKAPKAALIGRPTDADPRTKAALSRLTMPTATYQGALMREATKQGAGLGTGKQNRLLRDSITDQIAAGVAAPAPLSAQLLATMEGDRGCLWVWVWGAVSLVVQVASCRVHENPDPSL